MNILYVTADDAAGQQFNGYLLHKALKELGHDSHMAVAQSSLNEPDIFEVASGSYRRINSLLVRIERALSLQSILPVSTLSLYFSPYYRNADIVHLQLLHTLPFFSLLNVPLMSRQHRVVWTIHDPWLMSGHCIHSLDCDRWLTGCGNCPDLTLPLPVKHDTTLFNWKLKNWVVRHSNVSLVVASEWMYDRVRRSPILSHLPCSLIPFGINADVFRPLNQVECRSRFGIPGDANVIAFRWTPHFIVKGVSYIEKALDSLRLDKPTYLLTFDAQYALDSLRNRYHFVELGWVDDRNLMVAALNAADIFLMPSIAEAFGMIAVEAMACGTPVIVFEGTSLPSVIHAPHGGIAVPYKDHEALAGAIKLLLEDRTLHQTLVENGLKIVQQEYTLDLYVRRHLELYEKLMAKEP
jgi:glycosyltransferase involved in cell wall biosynthesis